ncbi:MAG: hypothetical protein HYV46_13180 [candidate division NC10 bacterium]|nr:hypothetical protein [candidate division NC10 bacterium]
MPHELLKRIIERASDSLAESVYLRMLMDRRAVRGQLHLRGTVPTWEDIVTRAVKEATLTREEATRLLAEARNGRFAGVMFGSERSAGRQVETRTPDRAGGRRKRVKKAQPGKEGGDPESG